MRRSTAGLGAVALALVLVGRGVPARADLVPQPPPRETIPHYHSPNVAAALSNLAVIVPLVVSSQVDKHADSKTRNRAQAPLIAAGIIAGPAVGYIYGGCARRGLTGMGLRAAGGAVVLALAAAGSSVGEGGGGVILPGIGVAGVVVASAIWDMGTVANTVDARNRRLGLGVRVGAAPFSGAPAIVVDLLPARP